MGSFQKNWENSEMSPLMMRFFTLVGIALAAASMQLKARAGTLEEPHLQPAVQCTAAATLQEGAR